MKLITPERLAFGRKMRDQEHFTWLERVLEEEFRGEPTELENFLPHFNEYASRAVMERLKTETTLALGYAGWDDLEAVLEERTSPIKSTFLVIRKKGAGVNV